jgi:peptidoglycan/LPS O-acetylase OafA/YrhL
MKLPNIQILRAWAAMMIVVFHCGLETGRLAEISGTGKLFNVDPWGAGTSLFFAISGFIMVVTTASAFGSPAAALDFMRRRLIRIVPLYWALTTLMLGVIMVVPSLMMKVDGSDHLYVVGSYLFWPQMRLTGDIRPLATQGWTLNLEMLFYVVFAVALLFSRRTGHVLLFDSLGLLVAARVGGLLSGVALNFWGHPIVLSFLFGAAVGIFYNRGVRLSGGCAILLLVIGFGALFSPWRPSGDEADLLPCLACGIPSAVVLAAVALGPQINESRRLWLPALLIGDASYSLYLLHPFLLRALYLLWLKGSVGTVLSLWAFVPAGIAIALGAAVMIFWYFERPVTRWLNGLQSRHVPVTPRLARWPSLSVAKVVKVIDQLVDSGEYTAREGRIEVPVPRTDDQPVNIYCCDPA